MIRPYQHEGTPSTVWYLEQTSQPEPRPAKTLDLVVQSSSDRARGAALTGVEPVFIYRRRRRLVLGGPDTLDLAPVVRRADPTRRRNLGRLGTRHPRRLRRTTRTIRRPGRTDLLRAAALLHRPGPWRVSAQPSPWTKRGPSPSDGPTGSRPLGSGYTPVPRTAPAPYPSTNPMGCGCTTPRPRPFTYPPNLLDPGQKPADGKASVPTNRQKDHSGPSNVASST